MLFKQIVPRIELLRQIIWHFISNYTGTKALNPQIVVAFIYSAIYHLLIPLRPLGLKRGSPHLLHDHWLCGAILD